MEEKQSRKRNRTSNNYNDTGYSYNPFGKQGGGAPLRDE